MKSTDPHSMRSPKVRRLLTSPPSFWLRYGTTILMLVIAMVLLFIFVFNKNTISQYISVIAI